MGEWEKFGSLPGWATFFMLMVWVIRTWPHWKAKINEARKIELDGHSQLREHYFERIIGLEKAAIEERKRCDEQLRALEKRLDGVVNQFIHFQMVTARAIPPDQRTAEMDHMLEQWEVLLRGVREEPHHEPK